MLFQGWCYPIFKKFLKDDTQYWNNKNTPVIVQFLKDPFFFFKVFIQILLHSKGIVLNLLTEFAISQIECSRASPAFLKTSQIRPVGLLHLLDFNSQHV